MRVLLDTNICIYIIKNKPPELSERLEEYELGDVGVSTITVAELEYGVWKSRAVERNRQALKAFLLPLEFVPFDDACAMKYGQLRACLERKGTPIGSMDMLIAAQALTHGHVLVTNNLKEFERVPDLKCVNWVM